MKSKPNHFLGALVCAAAAMEDSALFCASVGMPATATGEFMFMPGGMQSITPFGGGIGQPIQVLVDSQGAVQLEKQRAALEAKGAKPYFDFEHEDQGASFWPTMFFWKDGEAPGIYCRGEWTADGKAGVEGKRWRGFSPVFHVDSKRARPAQIICNADAVPNMGGLVNNPAFKKISPLWAKNAGGAQSATHQNTDTMTPEEMAALQAKNAELTNEIARLKSEQASIKAKNENDELVSARIEAKEAQLKATQAELETAALKAKNDEQAGEIRKQREATAKEIVGAAVARGAIAAKDTETIAAWEKDIAENPERGALLAKMGGNPAIGGQRLTTPGSAVRVTGNGAADAVRAYGEILAKNKAIPLTAATAEEKGRLADEAAAIFTADLSKGVDLAGAIMAADSTGENLGVLTGALAMQATLPSLLRENPLIGAVTTDFSSEPGMFNRTDNTRIVLRPAVQTYVATAGTDGRPQGWTTSSPAMTVDVPVTLDQYFAVPLVFGVTTLAGTGRRLFDEQAPQAINAMGSYVVDLIKALFTAANYNGFKGTSLAAGATTSGSKTVTVTSTANAWVGAIITGTGIPASTYVAAVVDGTTLTLSKNATATGSSLTLTLSGQGDVPTAYTTYVKALASFAVADLDSLAAAFDSNNVPMSDRFAALSPAYYRKLGGDSNVLALMQGAGDASYLTDRRLPKMSNFELLNSPWFPTSSNRTGFTGHKAAAVVKTRLPMDISNAIPGTVVPGNVATINDPSTGLSMALVSYYNLQAGYAEWRPELMAGVAVGDRRAGLVLTSA
jgi:hypothetical protein